jgi:hypothetical protein
MSEAGPKDAMRVCQVDGCGHAAFARGLCQKHYWRARKNSGPAAKAKPGKRAKAD